MAGETDRVKKHMQTLTYLYIITFPEEKAIFSSTNSTMTGLEPVIQLLATSWIGWGR
jgi:hypothetical protein